jgi:hypothetical protein
MEILMASSGWFDSLSTSKSCLMGDMHGADQIKQENGGLA